MFEYISPQLTNQNYVFQRAVSSFVGWTC